MAKTAARERASYRCSECGLETVRWVGRCPECQAWGTIAEVGAKPGLTIAAGPVSSPARPIRDVPAEEAAHRPTGVAELDRVLGGGLVPGAVVLLAGEPGVGKSTLLLDVAQQWALGSAMADALSGAHAGDARGAGASQRSTAGDARGAGASQRSTAGDARGAGASQRSTAGDARGAGASQRSTAGDARGAGASQRSTDGDDVLLTHAGLTVDAWRALGEPPTATAAARLLNERPEPLIWLGGGLTAGGVAGPLWAEAGWELYEPWMHFYAAGGFVPFDQTHGHSSVVRFAERMWRCPG